MSRRPKRNWRRSNQLPKARPETLSADEARRIAIRAQGFADRRTHGSVGPKRLLSVAERLGALQIDSVNVLVRAHYMPAFSRLGPFRLGHLDDLAYKRRSLFESSWGHQASLIPTSLYPLIRHRMERTRKSAQDPTYRGAFARWAEANRDYVRKVRKEVRDHGPLGASALSEPGERRGPWWGWSPGKVALEWLFYSGHVAVAGRRNWERLYDLTERVIPSAHLEGKVSHHDAENQLLLIAARALGVATAEDLAYYFMRKPSEARKAVSALVSEGSLQQVAVEGWNRPVFILPKTTVPKGAEVRALISPFDSLVWDRKRTSRLFGFDYRIEIYVPAPKRQYGYYVLPFLLGDRFVGRVDLKADRASRTLLVQAIHLEDSVREGDVLEALADELRLTAVWLGLDSVRPNGKRKSDKALRKVLA